MPFRSVISGEYAQELRMPMKLTQGQVQVHGINIGIVVKNIFKYYSKTF